jgi:hypothetical protein
VVHVDHHNDKLIFVDRCGYANYHCWKSIEDNLVEKSENLASNMFPPSFLMIHNARTCGKDNISNTSRRQELIDPIFQVGKTDVESRRNDSTLVKTSVELNDNLA